MVAIAAIYVMAKPSSSDGVEGRGSGWGSTVSFLLHGGVPHIVKKRLHASEKSAGSINISGKTVFCGNSLLRPETDNNQLWMHTVGSVITGFGCAEIAVRSFQCVPCREYPQEQHTVYLGRHIASGRSDLAGYKQGVTLQTLNGSNQPSPEL